MIYELFEMVGKGNGDYGSEWKRVAVAHGSRDSAADLAAKRRGEKPSATFRMFAARSTNDIGHPLWDFPPLNA